MKFITEEALKLSVSPTSEQLAIHLDGLESSEEVPGIFREEFNVPNCLAVTSHLKETILTESQLMQDSVYLCGNSLGLQPKGIKKLLNEELDVWYVLMRIPCLGALIGVTGHFRHPYNRPWVTIDDLVIGSSARIVGALEKEVAIMNSLTANLHFLMVPFYNPTTKRFKIIMEGKAFPSDYFALESQVKFHGLDPNVAIIQVQPKEGRFTIDTNDILDAIKLHGDSIALVLFSGVQYYTGQYFDIPAITAAGHSQGAMVGWDLAHAAGNIHLKLHDWNVDFAAWCSYKYLNSGPGGIGGAFVHEKHIGSDRPRFAGWWGTSEEVKFEMDLKFRPIPGANGFRLSNPCVLAVVALKGSLDVFEKTSMERLSRRSKLLTGYLEYLIESQLPGERVRIITPRDPNQRGCQLSILFPIQGEMIKVFKFIEERGVICDERKPDVIRLAPAPLYNGFEDVWRVVELIRQAFLLI